MALNNWVGIGRLTADPQIKQTQSGVSVCNINIAVNRAYKSGTERKADFIPVIAWRGTAEFISKYFSKGDPIQIEGRLETRTYEDSNGAKRFVMEVIADNVAFVEGAAKKDTQNNGFDDGEFAGFNYIGTPEDDELPFP